MCDCDYFLDLKNPADKWCDKLRQKVAAGKNGRLSTPHNQTNLCDKGRSFKLLERVYSNSKFGNFLHLFIVSLTRERRGREFAETFCFVTLTQATIVSVLFSPFLSLLQKRLVKLATTIKATVTATSLNFLSDMPNNLGGKRSDTTAPKRGRWEKPIFFLFKTIVPPAV